MSKKTYLNFTPNISKVIKDTIKGTKYNGLQLLYVLTSSSDVADKAKASERLRPSYLLNESDFEAIRTAARTEFDTFMSKVEEMEAYLKANPDLCKGRKIGRPKKGL